MNRLLIKNKMKYSNISFMNFELNGYKFLIHLNVLKYNIEADHKITVEYDKKKCDNETPDVYLILDSISHHAFSHWVFDSAVYLPLFNKLKNLFPTIKIVLFEERKYKLMMIKYFNIDEKTILYNFKSSHNICIFPQFFMYAIENNRISTDFYYNVNRLFDSFNFPNIKKTTSILIMPRHSTENNLIINHEVDTTDIEKKMLICPFNKSIDTSKLNSLQEQIDLVTQSRVVIIPDGSASIVNGMFAKNSIIISLGITTYYQSFTDSHKIKIIVKKIAQNNIFIYVPFSKNKYDALQTYTYDMIEELTNSKDVTKICENLGSNIYMYNPKKIKDIPKYNFDD